VSPDSSPEMLWEGIVQCGAERKKRKSEKEEVPPINKLQKKKTAPFPGKSFFRKEGLPLEGEGRWSWRKTRGEKKG